MRSAAEIVTDKIDPKLACTKFFYERFKLAIFYSILCSRSRSCNQVAKCSLIVALYNNIVNSKQFTMTSR